MFERLVVSTIQRRKHTTAKFFLGTMALYAFALACAFVVSILVSNARLADTSSVLTLVGPPPMPGGTPPGTPPSRRPPPTDSRADPNHAMTLEEIFRHRNDAPPVIPNIDQPPAGPGSAFLEGPPGVGPGIGVPGGNTSLEPPPRPEPPKPRPAAQTTVADNRPLRVTSNVLQGKAIERRVPLYPPLARQIRLHGDVSIEVIISPDGRVETARVVSGHPMLAQNAREAALGWRFEPTLLNNVPVRVTGVITFVFKMNE